MTILSNFEQSFNVPSNAMDQLKAKIINHEEVDLFSFLYNLPKDDLPNIGPSTSSTVNPFESLIYNEEALSRYTKTLANFNLKCLDQMFTCILRLN